MPAKIQHLMRLRRFWSELDVKEASSKAIGFIAVCFGVLLFRTVVLRSESLLVYSWWSGVIFSLLFLVPGAVIMSRRIRLLGGWLLTAVLTLTVLTNIHTVVSNLQGRNFALNWIAILIFSIFTVWAAWATSVNSSLADLIKSKDRASLLTSFGVILAAFAFIQSVEPRLDIHWERFGAWSDKRLRITNDTFASADVELTTVILYLTPGAEKPGSEPSDDMISDVGTSAPVRLGNILPKSSAIVDLKKNHVFADPPVDNYDVKSVYCLLFVARNGWSGKENAYLLMTSSNLGPSSLDDLSLHRGNAAGGPFKSVVNNLMTKERLRNACKAILSPYKGSVEL